MFGTIIYGFTCPDKCFKPWFHGVEGTATIADITRWAFYLRDRYPDVREIVVVDASAKLCRDFNEAKRKDSLEGWIEFKDLVERQGIVID